MTAAPRPRAVLFDAYETLVFLDDPVGRLRRALEAAGHPNDHAAVARAFAAEVAYYRRNQDRGRDPGSLESLRRDCAGVFRDALDVRPPRPQATSLLMDGLVWRPFDDARPALEALSAAAFRLAVVSNWDASLPDVLTSVGLSAFFSCVSVSAVVGARKPEPAIFHHALGVLGVAPSDTVHVGNDAQLDVAGATAAGIRAVLLDRSGGAVGANPPRVESLTAVPLLVGAG